MVVKIFPTQEVIGLKYSGDFGLFTADSFGINSIAAMFYCEIGMDIGNLSLFSLSVFFIGRNT